MDSIKIIRGINKTLQRTTIGVGIYIVGLLAVEEISRLSSPRIENQTQLEQKVKEEREILGIPDSIIIRPILKEEGLFTGIEWIRPGEYELFLVERYAEEHAVRHELYHVADGHFGQSGKGIVSSFPAFLKYIFWQEPRAKIYALTGLRL